MILPLLLDVVEDPAPADTGLVVWLIGRIAWVARTARPDWFAGLLDADAVVVRMVAVLGLRHSGVPIGEAQLPLLVEGSVARLRKVLVAVIGRDDVLLRYHVMMQSVDVLHPSMLPAIAAWLTDPDPPNRFGTGYLPAAPYADTAPYADDIATRLTDWPPSAHAAMVALAVLGDERAVEPLVRWLPEGRTTSVMTEGDFWTPPPLAEVLIGMRAHADALLPAVRERLDKSTDEAESAAFRRVVEAWQAPRPQ